ncbi:hypothetical protein EJ03DRAFT_332216 [Teratosphaeria nubilosa]|uniref:Uncharacterized protein n=1 Tax=Teratosphaeria nubilosa TaxID=161662 RepID=A0A6G1KTS3_9PEZI|nr:hypothetical protein EJ03DRAFT_332216 [Teratosphaeria nubilosa]
MNLPIEIRQMIYDFALGDEPRTILVFPKNTRMNRRSRLPLPLPVLARVGDRKLRLEVIKYFLENTTIEMHSGPANDQFRSTRWRHKLRHRLRCGQITELSLLRPLPTRQAPGQNPNNDMELALSCRNLRTLRLTFVDAELCVPFNELFFPTAKPIEQLRREYRLDGLLELEILEELKLSVVETNFVSDWAGGIGWAQATKLAEWFETEFEAQGRKRPVKVILV